MIRSSKPKSLLAAVASATVVLAALVVPETSVQAAGVCDLPLSVACENTKAGTPSSEWELGPTPEEPTIEGFTTDISYNVGDTARFKIRSAGAYTMDVYRMGYYAGLGARKVATGTPTGPQSQPACLTDASTGLVDCGNWAQSATWAIPSTAVSGIYFAKLSRTDTGEDAHVVFVVRNDSGASKVVFQTSDTTWQAYNNWGGNSLYAGEPAGRAYKVSYNRPFNTRNTPNGRDFVWANEYPMVRFLEANGYDVSYISGVDTDRSGSLLLNHKAFLSVGHDEYWSGQQRTNVEAARDAGVNLAFFSGNEVFWKTRWENSIDGTSTGHRTLVTYKSTRDNAQTDPTGTWTGTWRDPRFSPPGDGGRPENALTGQLWTVNTGNDTDAIKVTADLGKMRFWRHTPAATLAAGATYATPPRTLGYEWDEAVENGVQPAGLVRLSNAVINVPEKLIDYGSTVAPGTATHEMTLYKALSGALVFGAGTVQWSWGLDAEHDGPATPIDAAMRQATVNVLADMGAQPTTLQTGLVATPASTDTNRPSSTVTAPAAAAQLQNGSTVTISGTASDQGGKVAGVEVSTDGGQSWHPAQGRESWSYSWKVSGFGAVTIKTRAVDDSGNIEIPGAGRGVTVICPCSLFAADVLPASPSDPDTGSIELGVRFRSDVSGWVTGVRFYKGTGNSGTHTGTLWTIGGQQLATAVFAGESASGWQEVTFAQPVPVDEGVTYVASYYAPNGRYAADSGYFLSKPLRAAPLTAPQATPTEGNGLYRSGTSGFPTATFQGGNYYVSPVLVTTPPPDNTAPTVVSTTPTAGTSSVPTTLQPSVTFSEPVDSASITMTLTGPSGAVSASMSYDAAARKATLSPTALQASTSYTVQVSGARDPAGNVMSPLSFSYKTAQAPWDLENCPCSVWNDSAQPDVPSSTDRLAVELGVKFRPEVDGRVSGIRFYKGPENLGTHTGTLWSSSGQQLATATFTNESTSGWQEVRFSTPVDVSAGTTYVASYHAPSGGYAHTAGGLATGVTNGPVRALSSSESGGNGVYRYGASGFPGSSYGAANYWVDVVLEYPIDATPPQVTRVTPGAGATSVPVSTAVTVEFSEPLSGLSGTFTVKAGSTNVPGSVSYDGATRSLRFTPTSALAAGTNYTVTVAGVTDRRGNAMTQTSLSTFTTQGSAVCPCTIFASDARPGVESTNDSSDLELGTRFSVDNDGWITGVRFYKGNGNGGTHTGSLWSASGIRLAEATFANETTTGWQYASFAAPVSVTAGSTYVVSYHAPQGHYSASNAFFASTFTNTPLVAPASAEGAANGVYAVGGGRFPVETYQATNYWVDATFVLASPVDSVPPTVSGSDPVSGATSFPIDLPLTVDFGEKVVASTVQLSLATTAGAAVAFTSGFDAAGQRLTVTPTAALLPDTGYRLSVLAAQDLAGNSLSSPVQIAFRTAVADSAACPCSVFADSSRPAVASVADPASVEVGVRFRPATNGWIVGVEFYKGALNTGTHIGTLWSESGQQLARGTFVEESAAGWQRLIFAQPVQVTAGSTYVASYLAPRGGYAATAGRFASADVVGGPLTFPMATVNAPNGVYIYGPGGFPDRGTTTDYGVDVLFDTVAPPVVDLTAPAVSGIASAGTSGSFQVTWTTDEPSSSLVQYGTDPANLNLTATSAGLSTAHTVNVTGLLANTRYHFRVSSTDAAGNVATQPSGTPLSWAPVDLTAPVVSGIASAGTSGSFQVTWTTDESSTSLVRYGTDPANLNLTATSAGLSTAHSVNVTGLLANTRYHFRVSSTDAAGNVATQPGTPLSWAPVVQPIIHSSSIHFTPGAQSGTYVTESADGEVTLAPAVGAEFRGTTIPTGWTSSVVTAGGTATVASGVNTVDGARLTGPSVSRGRQLDVKATLRSGAREQAVGFGNYAAVGGTYALFITKSGDQLYARTQNGLLSSRETALGTSRLGTPRIFTVRWTTSAVVYLIDGVQVASHPISPSSAMRPTLTDRDTGGATVVTDWARIGPYAGSGTFTSGVLDAIGTVTWNGVGLTSTTPGGTSLSVHIRSGSSPTPDGTWSAWTAVPTGSNPNLRGRFVQYRLTLGTSNTAITPEVRDVTLSFVP